jgi:hypothetical protein
MMACTSTAYTLHLIGRTIVICEPMRWSSKMKAISPEVAPSSLNHTQHASSLPDSRYRHQGENSAPSRYICTCYCAKMHNLYTFIANFIGRALRDHGSVVWHRQCARETCAVVGFIFGVSAATLRFIYRKINALFN